VASVPRWSYRGARVERPRHFDPRRILDFVAEAETARLSDRRQITDLVVIGLGKLVPADITLVTDSDAHTRQTTTTATDPRLPVLRRRDPSLWLACLRQHPSVVHYDRTGDGGAVRFSDLLSRRAYQRLPLYQYFFRPFAIEYKLDVRLRPGAGHMDLGWCREHRDFDDAERALVDALAPYLTAILRRADAGTVAADIRDAFGLTHRQAEVLALVTRGKSNAEIAQILFLSAGTVRKHLEHVYAKLGVTTRTQAVARTLEARLASSTVVEPVVAMIQNMAATELPRLYALTDRELEVLALASAGTANSEIATTLRIAPETVKKHLDHVYSKLGVSGRAGATGRAISLGLV
jgi:DNA-binding CsgD family transcriptional regulator